MIFFGNLVLAQFPRIRMVSGYTVKRKCALRLKSSKNSHLSFEFVSGLKKWRDVGSGEKQTKRQNQHSKISLSKLNQSHKNHVVAIDNLQHLWGFLQTSRKRDECGNFFFFIAKNIMSHEHILCKWLF